MESVKVKVSKNKERLGETVIQNCGEAALIVQYVNSMDITIQFKTTGELVKTRYDKFVGGNVKSHFTPSVYGVGTTGLEPTRDENGEKLDSYNCWCNMLRRCYSAKFQEKNPTYIDCRVCDEWLYYPNFKNWYNENYYEVENKTSHLDKDILVKGNKVYSPDTCVFTPSFINSLFTKSQNGRGELPIGVYYDKKYKKYKAQLRVFNDGKRTKKHLGYFNTEDEAFEAYKKAKEEYIKEVADEYKDKIPSKLYKSMYAYEVNIDD